MQKKIHNEWNNIWNKGQIWQHQSFRVRQMKLSIIRVGSDHPNFQLTGEGRVRGLRVGVKVNKWLVALRFYAYSLAATEPKKRGYLYFSVLRGRSGKYRKGFRSLMVKKNDVSTTLTGVMVKRHHLATPVFLPGESQGQGSLVGCRLWGRTESDTTEAT